MTETRAAGAFGCILSGAVSSRPPGPLDDALREELERLAGEVARACPPYRASRREVALPPQLPKALRWYWEIFGHSALSQKVVAPDDPGGRETALDLVREWCRRDLRYEELAARVEHDHEVIAFDDQEVVLLSRSRARMEEDPPLVALREPTGASEGPDLEPHASSTLRYMVSGVLKGLWSELVRVLLSTRPPLEPAQPFPRVASQVWRAVAGSTPVWVAERSLHNRTGFELYFSHADAEAVDAWLAQQGLTDHMLL